MRLYLKRFSAALVLLACCLVTEQSSAADAPWKPLWNGKDLTGWTTWLRRPEPTSEVPGIPRGADGKYIEPIGSDRDPLNVFTVVKEVDGRPAILISGEAFGELRTVESYGDFHLRLQFKWGEKKWPPRLTAPRDSGLLYFVHAPAGQNGRTWARSIELQIQERDVGDLFAVAAQISVNARELPDQKKPTFIYDPKGPLKDFTEIPGQAGLINRCVKFPDTEKPNGEWNTVEIVCIGEDSIHIVNGQVVMRLKAARRLDGPKPESLKSGQIILQSEGAEIYYRDVEVRSITAVPAEFLEKK